MIHHSSFKIPAFIGRLCVFLFFLNHIMTFVYVLGSTQEFLDSSQALILQAFRIVSIAFLVLTIYFFVIYIIAMFRARIFRIAPLLLAFTGIAITSALYFGAEFILVLLEEVG